MMGGPSPRRRLAGRQRPIAACSNLHLRAAQAGQPALWQRAVVAAQVGVGRRRDAKPHRLQARNGDDVQVELSAAAGRGANPVAARLGHLRQRASPAGLRLRKHRQRLFGAVRALQHQVGAVDRLAVDGRHDIEAGAVNDGDVARLDLEAQAGVGRMIAVRIGEAQPLSRASAGQASARISTARASPPRASNDRCNGLAGMTRSAPTPREDLAPLARPAPPGRR